MFSLRKNEVGAEVYLVSLVYQPFWLHVPDLHDAQPWFLLRKLWGGVLHLVRTLPNNW